MSSKRGRDLEDAKRRKLARQRFRGLIRSVIFNRIWLSDVGDQKLSLNVKKNIAMLVRTQRKIGMLTLTEKTLLRTHVFYRTIDDRKKLTSFMASLTCLSRFTPKIRARLAPVVKFLIASKGRQVMKQGDIPMTLYFILTGEIEISTRVYDPLKKSYIDKAEFISGPGDCLGDVEMIENIPRRNTYTVTSEAELLVVFENDFDDILRPVMSKQWFEKKAAVTTLHYFNFFTYDQIITACKLGMLRQFEPLETICYEDKGQASYAYFVLSGECMILQCLKMRVAEKDGNKTFELLDISKDDSSNMFQDLTNAEFMQKLNQQNNTEFKDTYDIDQEILSVDNVKSEEEKKKALRKTDLRSIEISCGLRKSSHSSIALGKSPPGKKARRTEKGKKSGDGSDFGWQMVENLEDLELEEMSEEELEEAEEDLEEGIGTRRSNHSSVDTRRSKRTLMSEGGIRRSKETAGEDPRMAKKTEEAKNSKGPQTNPKANTRLAKRTSEPENAEQEIDAINVNYPLEEQEPESLSEFEEVEEEELSVSVMADPASVLKTDDSSKFTQRKSDAKYENHFIDVGSLTYGGIFGLGEKLEHRVIMARTTVQCLMLPRFWLFERDQNPGNVWQRRRFYLDCTIPSRQKLFKGFLSTRRWQKFKNDFIESNLNPNATNNPTKVQDVPIICRIVEAHD